MREGTAKLLAASKHPAQMLEAAKNLLTSNTRIMTYMTELQRRKTAEVLGKNVWVSTLFLSVEKIFRFEEFIDDIPGNI